MPNYNIDDVVELYLRAVAAGAPEATFDGAELLELLDRIRAIVPDEAAARRLFAQLAAADPGGATYWPRVNGSCR